MKERMNESMNQSMNVDAQHSERIDIVYGVVKSRVFLSSTQQDADKSASFEYQVGTEYLLLILLRVRVVLRSTVHGVLYSEYSTRSTLLGVLYSGVQ
jgi:hypothetical protein